MAINANIHNKYLTAAGTDSFWYESSMATFTKIAASDGDIDTSDQLTMFEAYQKVFIVNGSNLKVADFCNTKLTSEAQITSNIPAKGDILSQTGDDPAEMVVDYIYYDSDAADHYVYGYTTSGTFDTTHNVVDSDSNVIISAANLSAVAEATTTPHWYDWTPYNNDTTTYGSMPATAYLGCKWRGRLVLAGHPSYPYQWYMSRQADPWDWNYAATDAQSPISGQDGVLGEMGDVIRCLIPWRDDYLVVGCANSIYMFEGDPADSGSLAELDTTTGIFGANSWCMDGSGRIYFFGAGGLYVVESLQERSIRPLSSFALPNLVADEAIDPTTHRITLAFDRDREGVLVCITTLADGTNSNYYYDLKTEGFFPETYPEECGVFSSVYYDSNDPTVKALLLGSTDGYIRTFSASAKSDDIGPSDEAISSYMAVYIKGISDESGAELIQKLRSLRFTSGGGAASGSETDFDGFTFSIFAEEDPETCLEAIEDGDTPDSTGTVSGGGLTNRTKSRARGNSLMLKINNSTADETWALNKIQAEVDSGGRI